MFFDRDGTLVEDVGHNGDPDRVRLRPTAREAVLRVRAAGLGCGVVSNQSGLGRGFFSVEQMWAVARRVEQLMGTDFDGWVVCPHSPAAGCGCRKPRPGGLLAACRLAGVAPAAAAYVGDIGADLVAADAAGLRAVLVPTPRTRAEEVAAAAHVRPDLAAAVELLLATGVVTGSAGR